MGTEGLRDTRIRTTCDARAPESSDSGEPELLESGATVGRYLILDVLGSGGMSVVYGAYDPQLDRRVALKLMRTADDGRLRQHVRDRLMREGQALARLAHPNVVAVHDVGMLADQVFVAMEYVEGQTLAEWLDDEHSRDDVLEVFRHAGEGLAAAHAEGLVHRDFKPANVMIDPSGRVRVVDFGLARPSGAQSSDVVGGDSDLMAVRTALSGDGAQSTDALGVPLTVTGAVMGTPAYMAPEQHSGGRSGPATDQFAFCVALFEALYGRRPFAGRSRAELRANVLHGRLREPPRRRDVPRRLRRAILRGLSVHPMHRWPSMRALLAELQHVPRAQRRRRVAVVVAVLGVGAIPLSNSALLGSDPGACVEALSMTGVWDEARHAALAKRMSASEVPWVAEAWPDIAARLDTHADRWTRARDAVCEIEPEPSMAQLDCLRDERTHMGEVLAVLGQGGPDAVQLAYERLSAMPDPWSCGDSDSTEAQIAEVAPTVADLRQQLMDLQIQLAAVDARAVPEHSMGLLAAAEESGDQGLEAEAWLLHGRVLMAAERWDDAEPALERAWRRAISAQDDATAFSAALALVHVSSAKGRSRDALGWVRDAAAFEARGGQGPLDRARLRVAEALADRGRGETDLARQRLNEALDVRRSILGAGSPGVAEVRLQLGALERAEGRTSEAVMHYREAKAALERSLGPEDHRVIELELRLGEALLAAGDTQPAQEALGRGLATARRVFATNAPQLVGALLEAAEIHRALGLVEDAESLHREAEFVARARLEPRDPRLARAVFRRAVDLRRRDELEDAETLLREALELERAAGPHHPRVAAVLDELARVRRARGEPKDALALSRAAESIWRAEPDAAAGLAQSLVLAAWSLLDDDDPGMALAKLDQALAIIERRRIPGPLEARARLLRARGLLAVDPDSVLARREARAAAAHLDALRTTHATLRDEVDRWLSAHDDQP
ncbi:MAG: tetratricopeptide repeat protein [Myxococcota bacterium]